MNGEKVKEIKKVLEEEPFNTIKHHKKEGGWIVLSFQEILTLINELESKKENLYNLNQNLISDRQVLMSENERLMKLQARGGCRVAELGIENQKLKDRIAELEKKIKENAFYSKGYAQGIKNTYEVVIPDKLKQFAERLKEKFDEQKYFYETASISHRDISLTALNTAYRCLDETLKEYEK